ncbi:MAG: hypothetical protein L6V88_07360 [Anaerotruncus sp.]|nr:MAG: hypothetical protein L6V88_07360 [Anaerotruncus sp.]
MMKSASVLNLRRRIWLFMHMITAFLPNEEVAVQLENLLAAVAEIKDEKKIIFDEGDYYIESAKLQSRMLYITNTVGDAEFKNGETPHKNRCALAFCGIENAEFDFFAAQSFI